MSVDVAFTGVNIIGLDMQNNIEVDKTEQKYCKIKENKTSKYHYAKIRKSVEKIKNGIFSSSL